MEEEAVHNVTFFRRGKKQSLAIISFTYTSADKNVNTYAVFNLFMSDLFISSLSAIY